MLYDQVEVEAIKLSVSRIEQLGISCEQVLLKSIIYLKEKYEIFQDKSFLEKAMWNIYAYLELGYSYEDWEEELNGVLLYLGLNKKDILPFVRRQQQTVILNKTNIRNILGRWNPKLHSMKAEDVVLDIIKKVSEKSLGTYKYHSGKVISRDGDQILWEKTFVLYIRLEECVLYYKNKNIYYVFEG